MFARLKVLALSAIALSFCCFFCLLYYKHYQIERDQELVVGETTNAEMRRSRRGVETYTISYTYEVGGNIYRASDDVPEEFFKEYDSFNRDIKIRYQGANPQNSELFEDGLPENHNDIDWLHGAFIIGAGFMGLLWLREGMVGFVPWVGQRVSRLKDKLAQSSFPLIPKIGTRRELRDLRELKRLLEDGCITESEFETKKQELLQRV